jgi:hypothetical protein
MLAHSTRLPSDFLAVTFLHAYFVKFSLHLRACRHHSNILLPQLSGLNVDTIEYDGSLYIHLLLKTLLGNWEHDMGDGRQSTSEPRHLYRYGGRAKYNTGFRCVITKTKKKTFVLRRVSQRLDFLWRRRSRELLLARTSLWGSSTCQRKGEARREI